MSDDGSDGPRRYSNAIGNAGGEHLFGIAPEQLAGLRIQGIEMAWRVIGRTHERNAVRDDRGTREIGAHVVVPDELAGGGIDGAVATLIAGHVHEPVGIGGVVQSLPAGHGMAPTLRPAGQVKGVQRAVVGGHEEGPVTERGRCGSADLGGRVPFLLARGWVKREQGAQAVEGIQHAIGYRGSADGHVLG